MTGSEGRSTPDPPEKIAGEAENTGVTNSRPGLVNTRNVFRGDSVVEASDAEFAGSGILGGAVVDDEEDD